MKTFEVINGNMKFKDTKFYRWLDLKHAQGVKYDSFIDAVRTYTKFIEHPFKGRNDLDAHRWTYQEFERKQRTDKKQ